MGISYSDKIYRKVEYDTYNCFCDYEFRKYLEKTGLRFHRLHESGGYTKFTLFVTDEELTKILSHIDSVAVKTLKNAKDLYEKRDFFRKYFDSAEITEDCGLDLSNKDGSDIFVKVFSDKDNNITWANSYVFFTAQTGKYSFESILWNFREAHLMTLKNDDELKEMANAVFKRIKDCEEALCAKMKEEETNNAEKARDQG